MSSLSYRFMLALIVLMPLGCSRTPAQEGKEPPVAKVAYYYFGATWCEPCQKMKAEVFSNKVVVDAMDRKFGVNQDRFDIDLFRKLFENYKVSAVPTYIIFVDDREVRRGVGYRNVKDFLEWLK